VRVLWIYRFVIVKSGVLYNKKTAANNIIVRVDNDSFIYIYMKLWILVEKFQLSIVWVIGQHGLSGGLSSYYAWRLTESYMSWFDVSHFHGLCMEIATGTLRARTPSLLLRISTWKVSFCSRWTYRRSILFIFMKEFDLLWHILCGWSDRQEQSPTGHSCRTYIINSQKHAQDTSFLTFLLTD